MVKYGPIQQLIKNPHFQKLTQIAIQHLSAQTIFEKLAIDLVRLNNVVAIKFLISDCKFALTTVHDVNQITLLHEACLYHSVDVVDYLLSQGADPYAKDFDGSMPIHRVAQQQRDVTLVDVFTRHRLDLNRKNSKGMTVLHLATLNQKLCSNNKAVKSRGK